MKTKDEITPVEIYAGTPWHAGMLKSMLDDAGIETFLKDEIIGARNPWLTAPDGVGSVKVVVSSLDYDNAKAIVDEFEKNLD